MNDEVNKCFYLEYISEGRSNMLILCVFWICDVFICCNLKHPERSVVAHYWPGKPAAYLMAV